MKNSGDMSMLLAILIAWIATLTSACAVHLDTVQIEGATFTMGTPLSRLSRNYHSDEKRRRVTVETFRIGKYPITAEQMCKFLNSNAAKDYVQEDLYYHHPLIAAGSGKELHYSNISLKEGEYIPRDGAAHTPANQVTWKGAVMFCKWLSELTGKKYRLPTEAEWEWAARGRGRQWPWGARDPGPQHGPRYYTTGYKRGVSVGTHPANATPEGVRDILAYGIGEWCVNKYAEKPSAADVTNTTPDIEDVTSPRVVRGGNSRMQSRPGIISTITMTGGFHRGRPWTRSYAHPINAVRTAAVYGFRVVEEVSDE